LIYAIPKSFYLEDECVEPPGMPGCENLPYPISAGCKSIKYNKKQKKALKNHNFQAKNEKNKIG
jgi:hypothetical protein